MKTFKRILVTSPNLLLQAEREPQIQSLIRQVADSGVSIVLCSSGTFEESEHLYRKHEIQGPFIVENGGAVYFPRGHFPLSDYPSDLKGVYQKISLGLPYAQVLQYFALIKKLVSDGITGFHEMADEQLATDTGLTLAEAQRARMREYDEPFRIDSNPRSTLERIQRTLQGSEISLSKGSHFYHLTGGTAQAKALGLIRRLFADHDGRVSMTTLGLEPSDAPLLECVERPIVLTTADGRHTPRFAQHLQLLRKATLLKARTLEEALQGLLDDGKSA